MRKLSTITALAQLERDALIEREYRSAQRRQRRTFRKAA